MLIVNKSCKSCLKVFNFNGLNRLRERKSKNARVKVELTIKRALDVLRLPEPVLLSRKRDVRNRNSLRSHRRNHLLSLVRRNDLVFESLKKYHRTRQLLGKVDW